MPSPVKVLAPVQASTPPTSHKTQAIPGDGSLAPIEPGDVRTPLLMTMLMIMAKALIVLRFRLNVPRSRAAVSVAPSALVGF